MLKWLGGGGGPGSGGNGAADSFTHVGKVFNVNDYQVVVEELIAEGESEKKGLDLVSIAGTGDLALGVQHVLCV